MLKNKCAAGAVAFLFIVVASAFGEVIYVDDSAPPTGANNGSSWNDAFIDLHDGLKAAQPGDEVRIGQGTYKPAPPPPQGDRTASFSLPDGVIVQGGFAGFGAVNPDENNPQQFETILSGDLNSDDGKPGSWFGYEENSYHVVAVGGSGQGTELRGVTVRAGNADETSQQPNDRGAGILVESGSLLISFCTIEDNQALVVGGGISASQIIADHSAIRRNRQTDTFGGDGGASAGAGSAFTDCVFEDNVVGGAAAGGGLGISGGLVERCTFIGNHAPEQAGAMRCTGETIVIESQFIQNSGGSGGGGAIMALGSLTVSDCSFTGNSAYEGGAVEVLTQGSAVMRDCVFEGNMGVLGGALNIDGAMVIIGSRFVGNSNFVHGGGAGGAIANVGQLELINCVFQQNSSHDFAGVMYNVEPGNLKAVNCRFTNNHSEEVAAVLHNAAEAELVNCTIAANLTRVGSTINDSGALHNRFDGTLTVNNCIVFGNQTADGQGGETAQIWNEPGGVVAVNNSFIEGRTGTYGGVGNSGANPQMVNDSDNFRLTEGSPCINAGDNAWLPNDAGDIDDDGDTAETIPLDLDLHTRVVSGTVDAGAYEFQGEVSVCEADIAPDGGDGNVNTDDLLLVINNWGATGENPADITGNGTVDVDDLLAVINAWGGCNP